MATTILPPDAIISSTNLTGAVTDIDEPILVLQTGLLAEYRMDEGVSATTQVVTDSSGNGLHGVRGSSSAVTAADPTWTATGLSFDGGDTVAIPGPLAAVYGIDIVFKPSVAWNAATAGNVALLSPGHSATGVVIGTFTGTIADEIITVRQNASGGYAQDGQTYYAHASEEITANWHLLQLDVRAATDYWTITLDGTNRKSGSTGTPAGPFLSDDWQIGVGFSFNPITGDIAYVVFYGDMGSGLGRSDAQQAYNRTVLTSILAGRGITLP